MFVVIIKKPSLNAQFPPPQDRIGWANKGQQRSKF